MDNAPLKSGQVYSGLKNNPVSTDTRTSIVHMHRIMQHQISRMFLARNGTLTPYVWLACEFDDLAGAVEECQRFHLAPSDFSFRVFEHEPGEELQVLAY